MKWIIFAVALAVVVGGALWFRQSRTSSNDADDQAAEEQTGAGAADQSGVSGELRKEFLAIGQGAEVKAGDSVSVHYVGTLLDGTKFDSSRDRGEPFSFVVGAAQVIAGWDQGLLDVPVGSTIRLTIPPSLGYGERGAGALIGPGATLVFEIEVLSAQETK